MQEKQAKKDFEDAAESDDAWTAFLKEKVVPVMNNAKKVEGESMIRIVIADIVNSAAKHATGRAFFEDAVDFYIPA